MTIHRRMTLAAAFAMATAAGSLPAQRPHDETADRVAIEALVVEYSYLLDHGRATELADLFTPNGIFDNESLKQHAVGRAAIAAYYARRATEPRTTRHVTTNLRIEFETPDRARGTRTILYFRGDGPGPTFPAKPASVGEYLETYQRGGDGRWRFASRVSKLVFVTGTQQPGQ